MEPTTVSRLGAAGQDCAILFARTPQPGRVKSRLHTHLTAEQACRLHCAATNDAIELLDNALPDAAKWLFLSEPPQAVLESSGLILPRGFGCAVQQGSDLGQRLAAAFGGAFSSGARRVVIFGSDSPTLPRRMVQESFRKLEQSDVVVGPAADGGYYLIGCRRFDPRLLEAVEWSTARTLEQTLANARSLCYEVALLDKWFDIDEWSDVERLLADERRGVPIPRHLAAFLRAWVRR